MIIKRATELLLCLLCLAATGASAQQAIEDKAQCFTTWDDNYIYLSFKVDCPDVQSKHSAPNADITGDDCVTVYLETDNKHADKITPACFSMAVSAGGGAQFCQGTKDGKLEAKMVHSFKYGVTVQGTPNNSDDIDTGYCIEMALPWELLQTKTPKLGDMMSFNIVVRRHGWKPIDVYSYAPRAKTEADLTDPSKWANVVFTTFAFVASAPGEKVLSTRSVAAPPLIDGVPDPREWPKNSSFALRMPVPEGFVYEAKFPVQRMVFAPYYYTWQRDPRKPAPFTNLAAADGGIALQDFPIKSIGPWFSWDRVEWHKEQAADAVAAGIDVILPVFRGDKASRDSYALKGLDCLVSALLELKSEGKPYPLIGMLFDCSSMETAYRSKPDLTTGEAKRAFYGVVRSFFDRVPPELRAFSQTAKSSGGRIAPLLFLSGTDSFSKIDDSIVAYVNQQFEQDFGSPLIWVGPAATKQALESIDGCAEYGGQSEPLNDASSRIRISSVAAGFDDSAWVAKAVGLIRSRMGGESYQKAWSDAIAANPQWVVCGSWNNFVQGSDLCASREYGRRYIDDTRAAVTKLQGRNDLNVQFLRCSMPEVIPSKTIAQAEIVVRNIGALPWRASEGYALGYRWYRGGRYVCDSKVRRLIDKDILPGDSATLTIGIASVDVSGTALPEGSYELRIEMIRTSDNKWFSAMGDQPLIVPITLGQAPEWRATYVTCEAPVMAAVGQSYQMKMRVRNDGTKTWSKGKTKLGCKLYKASNYTHDGYESAEVVPSVEMRSVLTSDCKPGDIATFSISLEFKDPSGKPLPAWRLGLPWSYQLRFDLNNGDKWLAELGSREMRRNIDLYDSDYGARIVDSNLPTKLTAGQTYSAKVVVRNGGVHTWDRRKTKIGYHWYHLDGNLMQWDNVATALDADVKPGWPAMLNAKVKAPEYDGQYILCWDVMVDDVWLSTLPITRGGDLLPVFVQVTNGKLAFADLSSLFDTVATSADTNRSAGDFDGKGRSFPAEYLPPDAGAADQSCKVYPSGYEWRQDHLPDGRISFQFSDKTPGTKNALACKGQKILVERGAYLALHIAAASIGGEAAGDLSINYSDRADTAKLAVSDWTSGPSHGEGIVCATRHIHSHGGDDTGMNAYLYHYSVPLTPSRTLTSITLPANPNVKVVAITLERAALPPVPAPVK